MNQFSGGRINVSNEKRCPTSMADWHTNFPRFQVARPGHVQVESSRYCRPRELESFVRPGPVLENLCYAFSFTY